MNGSTDHPESTVAAPGVSAPGYWRHDGLPVRMLEWLAYGVVLGPFVAAAVWLWWDWIVAALLLGALAWVGSLTMPDDDA